MRCSALPRLCHAVKGQSKARIAPALLSTAEPYSAVAPPCHASLCHCYASPRDRRNALASPYPALPSPRIALRDDAFALPVSALRCPCIAQQFAAEHPHCPANRLGAQLCRRCASPRCPSPRRRYAISSHVNRPLPLLRHCPSPLFAP